MDSDLSATDYVCVWGDGVHPPIRLEEAEAAGPAMVFKEIGSARARLPAVDGPRPVVLVRAGTHFERGLPVKHAEGIAACTSRLPRITTRRLSPAGSLS